MYEEIFDSYTMDLETFKAQLNARLSEFNENEDGYVYYIASDAWNYYLVVCLPYQLIQFRKVKFIFRHGGLHGAILGMGIG